MMQLVLLLLAIYPTPTIMPATITIFSLRSKRFARTACELNNPMITIVDITPFSLRMFSLEHLCCILAPYLDRLLATFDQFAC
jgi:hypothetical protein